MKYGHEGEYFSTMFMSAVDIIYDEQGRKKPAQWVLLGFSGFTGLYWALLGFTGLYWAFGGLFFG